MNLYLIDKPYGCNGIAIAGEDRNAKLVLIQDGVYFGTAPLKFKEVYAVKDDVKKRGLENLLDRSIKQIGYGELVDLIVENKVINFA